MGGITASEYSQRASKPEERQALIDAINHAKSVLVKLEGAFQLSWQDEVRCVLVLLSLIAT